MNVKTRVFGFLVGRCIPKLVLFWKPIILLTIFPIHHNFKKLQIPSRVWNSFGLQMDLDPSLEGRLQEVEEEDVFLF
jgi:hypothetical protein